MPTPPPPNKAPAQKQTKSTQNSLQIAEIRDGIVILRDGSLRAVILGSAINFDLMSPSERDSVEYAYQGFLNSLHFTVQILIRSQKIDLDGYIEKLGKLRQDQDNDLLASLMDDYILNIRTLVDEVNIMDKQFYTIVPFFPAAINKIKQTNLVAGVGSLMKPLPVTTVSESDFHAYKEELAQRVQLVSSGLSQMGIRAIPLNTQELIDLYYASYNPDVAQNQKLIDVRQLQTAAVTKGLGQAPPPIAGGKI